MVGCGRNATYNFCNTVGHFSSIKTFQNRLSAKWENQNPPISPLHSVTFSVCLVCKNKVGSQLFNMRSRKGGNI